VQPLYWVDELLSKEKGTSGRSEVRSRPYGPKSPEGAPDIAAKPGDQTAGWSRAFQLFEEFITVKNQVWREEAKELQSGKDAVDTYHILGNQLKVIFYDLQYLSENNGQIRNGHTWDDLREAFLNLKNLLAFF
jgi:hypothetical protein